MKYIFEIDYDIFKMENVAYGIPTERHTQRGGGGEGEKALTYDQMINN